MKTIKIICMILLTGVAGLFAQTKVGTTAANFLTVPVGSKAAGMGGAFVAVANDATSLFWNVGGISRLERSEFNVSYSDWLVGTNYNWAGLVFKGDEDAFGISINQLDYGDEEITTPEQPNGTGQRWKAQDIALGVSYSRNLTDRFSIGGTVKYIRQQIWNESASAFALDVGLLFYTQLPGLKIGMNIANFGTEMKLDGKDLYQPVDVDPANTGNNEKITATLNTDYWTLPLVFTVGLGYDFTVSDDFKVEVATDAVYPNNHTAYLNLGGEITWSKMISLRAGYNSLMKSEEAEEGLNAGVGFHYDFGAFSARIDYSYADYKRFKDISKVSLSIGF